MSVTSGKDIHENSGSSHLESHASGLKRLEDNLKKLSLLRVYPHGLNGRDAKERRVEFLQRAVEEVATQNVEAARTIVVFVVVSGEGRQI